MTLAVGFDTSALDATFKEHAGRGIGRYVRELTRYFDRLDGRSGEVSVGYFDHTTFKSPLLDTLISAAPAGRQTLRQQLVYPLHLGGSRTAGFDLLHFPAHMDAPSWSPKRYIITVLDLIPIVCRDLYEDAVGGVRFRLARWLELQAIRSAALILAISECTARDVQRVLGIPAERIRVTPLGVDAKFFTVTPGAPDEALRARLRIPTGAPVVLYVGGIDPRKNYPWLIEAFAALVSARAERGETLPVLVMAGRIDRDREYPRFRALAARSGVVERIIETGYVPEEDLLALYGASSLLFFPSLYEGFGFPVLEAMAAGLPVVSSNTSSLPEVVGEAGLLVSPGETGPAVAGMQAILSGGELPERLRADGRARARRFSWDRTGEETVRAYATLGQPGARPPADIRQGVG